MISFFIVYSSIKLYTQNGGENCEGPCPEVQWITITYSIYFCDGCCNCLINYNMQYRDYFCDIAGVPKRFREFRLMDIEIPFFIPADDPNDPPTNNRQRCTTCLDMDDIDESQDEINRLFLLLLPKLLINATDYFNLWNEGYDEDTFPWIIYRSHGCWKKEILTNSLMYFRCQNNVPCCLFEYQIKAVKNTQKHGIWVFDRKNLNSPTNCTTSIDCIPVCSLFVEKSQIWWPKIIIDNDLDYKLINNTKVNLIPNPIKNSIDFYIKNELKFKGIIKIFDNLGNLVNSSPFNKINNEIIVNIDLQNQANGLYLYQILLHKNITLSGKFIKE